MRSLFLKNFEEMDAAVKGFHPFDDYRLRVQPHFLKHVPAGIVPLCRTGKFVLEISRLFMLHESWVEKDSAAR